MTEHKEDIFTRRDKLICELWLIYDEMSDELHPELWSEEDLKLWQRVTLHSSFKRKVNKVLIHDIPRTLGQS